MRKGLGFLVVCLGSCLTIYAQDSSPRVSDSNKNGWFMYFGDHPISRKWQVHLEGQWRRHDVINRWQQLLLRPAINLEVNPNLVLTGGYAYVKSFPYGDFPARDVFPEHRIFQQLLLKHKVGRVDVQHRYRLEQRFIGQVLRSASGSPAVDSWRYQNRFRYFVKAALPLSSSKESKWYLGFYDEVFLHFAPNSGASVFDQNRAYAALGRKLSRTERIEVGYMNQTLIQRSGRVQEYNHTLQVSFFSAAPFRFGQR